MFRIAITGSAGVGKSTFADRLANALGCNLIDENYDSLFQANGAFITPPSRLKREIINLLDYKSELENQAGEFISDRCAADLFNLWLTRGFGANEIATSIVAERCRQCLSTYSHLIVLPWGAIPLVQIDDTASYRRRVLNPWRQFWNQATLVGIVQHWVPAKKLILVPKELSSLERRICVVLDALRG